MFQLTSLVRDRTGRFSALRAATLAAMVAPALWIAYQWWAGLLAARLYNDLNHQFGLWGIRFLLLSMAITPIRTVFGLARVMGVRRMVGVTALFYLLAHFLFYVIDSGGRIGFVTSEIVLRWYLTIGFAALIMMVALGITSFDRMIRRLGATHWRQLHSLVHLIAVLGILHFFMQSKLAASEAALMLGFLLLLEGYRLLARFKLTRNTFWLGIIAVAGGVLTALLQAGWYGIATRIPAMRVLEANFNFMIIAPAWWVLGAGLAVAVAAALPLPNRSRRGRPALAK